MQTVAIHLKALTFSLTTLNSFINFCSCEVVLSSDMRKNEAYNFTSTMAVDVKLGIHLMYKEFQNEDIF